MKSEDHAHVTDVRRLPPPERHLTVTPLDMRQPRFGTAMRGFDRQEVTAFLEEAATDYESALRENDRLRGEIVRLEASLNQFRELEGSLKSTLMSAQKVADDMRENAAQEAARILREAEGRADLLVQKAQARQEDIEREIDGLRLKRREVETNIEAAISALHNTLDFIREQERRERENRVVPHRPHVVHTA
ncbi:MAG: DivIVA domain-containing protein [Acidobacteria bacterium]|nr:DivIVA domain-containing protein [Acidobacteriota bacterium]